MLEKLVLASNNQHKISELKDFLSPHGVEVIAPKRSLEVLEDGLSFEQNAFKKAFEYFKQEGIPVLSDDSGILVDALPNELGIHSKRFGGEELSTFEKNELLLKKLENVDLEKRGAYFLCKLCFMLSEKEVYFFEGRVKGKISFSQSGDGGFGYDPVFLPDAFNGSRSLAEESEWKQQNSHRACALKEFVHFLSSLK